jgi:predicted acetyltransferase
MMFIEPGLLQDGDLILQLDRYVPADPEKEWLPTYHFKMLLKGSATVIGGINLRIGNSDRIVLYRGHIGYGVEPEYRGHRFAARSVRLLIPLAEACGLNPVWITCDPDNIASRRSCELAEADFIEIIDVPPDEEIFRRGVRQKCRYRLFTVPRETF